MDLLWNELSAGIPDGAGLVRILLRMLGATVLGAVVGYERERTGKSAGLRTHMLVALGSAVFVIAPLEAGLSAADVSRIVQGVAAGIGFIGAGAILKRTEENEVLGLTTAAGIWLTAAIGIAAGLGSLGVAAIGVLLALLILSLLARLERRAA
jgi:putative Mg2+ transporter-C (MgtC) family protein